MLSLTWLFSLCLVFGVRCVVARGALLGSVVLVGFLFFFQAEDGIRDDLVTGVQTCALPIFAGSVMIMLSSLAFSVLARADAPTLLGLGLVNGFDNLAQAMHGTALIAFLSSLTSARYTATQYALFSSLYALPGKFLEGFSGRVVEAIGYPHFFIYTAALSVPALLLLVYLVGRGPLRAAGSSSGS